MSIFIVLPLREAVTSGQAGAVALTVAEFNRASVYRDRTIVLGGGERGDYEPSYESIAVRRFHPLGLPWLFWKRLSHCYADAVADHIGRCQTELVEVHNHAPLFKRLARRLPARTPLCLHLHNDPQTMAGLRLPSERRAVLERASLVYCVSNYIRDRFVAGIEGSLDRVVTLYNGVIMPREDREQREKVILFVGRLIPEKGVDALMEALRRIAPDLPDWRVVIVGQPHKRQRERYRSALEGLGEAWGQRLIMRGFLAHGDVMREYGRAAITVVPSLWQEPFGRVALEAMAAGSAVIASRSGGLTEVVGDAGLLIDSVTPDALARAILSLARDPHRCSALHRAGRAAAERKFEIGLLTRQLDEWRTGILAPRS
jgi:glycosyltransferase involved in cell wall biosynthesis